MNAHLPTHLNDNRIMEIAKCSLLLAIAAANNDNGKPDNRREKKIRSKTKRIAAMSFSENRRWATSQPPSA